MNTESKISLVGAGPGDPDLISVRGVKAISTADVILYDALVHPSLLDYAPNYALRIYVGKRSGNHYCSQDEINEKLVEFSQIGHVVRLKGGDPFVFGRGYEELEHARNCGVPIEVIPGISSATAVSGWNGLPITLRNVSRSFHVITAVGKKGQLSEDILSAPSLKGTVVILMGFKKLEQIIEVYNAAGKENLGIAVIQNGTLAHQKSVFGTISNIKKKLEDTSMTTPAIIYIGEVVNTYLNNKNNIKNGAKKSVISGVFQIG